MSCDWTHGRIRQWHRQHVPVRRRGGDIFKAPVQIALTMSKKVYLLEITHLAKCFQEGEGSGMVMCARHGPPIVSVD